MTSDPRGAVLEVTDFLATRLDPIIARVLEPQLGGLEWTAILAELDRIKGRRSLVYGRNDLQSQLRVLTERLGSLGYPFDDDNRTVSSVAGDLRTVRRNLAHTNPFTRLEAWRAADQCVRLLEALHDEQGLLKATDLRHKAFMAYAEESGLGPAPAQAEDGPDQQEVPGTGPRPSSPGDVNGKGPDVRSVMDGRNEVLYERWPGRLAGEVEVLDTIGRVRSKSLVRTFAEEIVEFEWPIGIERLAKVVGQGFGLKRVTRDRVKKIIRQIHNSNVTVDEHGYVWPVDVDPEEWDGFRVPGGTDTRSFEEISPREIANAIKFTQAEHSELADTELELAVLELFGRSKRTKGVMRQLDLAWELV